MKIIHCERLTGWDVALAVAKATQAKMIEDVRKDPSETWCRKMIRSPHSPVRAVNYLIQFTCPYFVQNHLVRHHEGVQWFVGSQRNDRQSNYDRNAARQDTEVIVSCIINGDALKFISRRRLCNQASAETRAVWRMIVEAVCEIDPVWKNYLVPECVASGFCPEFKCCGFVNTEAYAKAVSAYREVK